MTEQERIEAKIQEADQVVALVADFLISLQIATGYSPEVILAGAHAQLIAMMATTLGGPMTAKTCADAAERVRHLPSLAAASLAMGTPVGRA